MIFFYLTLFLLFVKTLLFPFDFLFESKIFSTFFRSFVRYEIKMRIKSGLSIFLLIVFLVACEKDAYSPLPHVEVNIQIYPNSAQFIDLNSGGGFVYLTANYPSRGIIVYRISDTDFVAFERTCPHDPYDCCEGTQCPRLMVDESRLTISDSCCGSIYLILDGSNVSGPSTYRLKQYHTSYDGNVLYIYD